VVSTLSKEEEEDGSTTDDIYPKSAGSFSVYRKRTYGICADRQIDPERTVACRPHATLALRQRGKKRK
jgi:hypothetical protein